MHTIPVHTASTRYPVYVGADLLPALGEQVRGRRVFVVSSPPLWELWGPHVLRALGSEPPVLLLPSGEQAKRLPEAERLLEELAGAGADRHSLLLAFGGGVVGDMAGFLAAIYMRGIPCVQIPTTLLAQVDSSVGGKTGVNLAAGKNLVGAFHHPQAVFADVALLRTLPPRELRAGLMESVKAGVIRSSGLFDLLEENVPALQSPEPDAKLLAEIVAQSVAIKAGVVAVDEREAGPRMILNLGHTLGHAIEAVTGYRALLHGEAVGWGMLAAFQIARGRGLMSRAEEQRAGELVRALGRLPRFAASAPALLEAAGRDKKNAGLTRRFVLPRGIGDAVVVEDVTDRELLRAAEEMLAEARDA